MSTTKDFKERAEKSISVLKQELNTVRAGRANAALLDQITVEYYGTPTPLKNLSNISVPDPRTLMITPFDPSSIQAVEKAIMTSNLGINPSNDGKNIRLVIPPVTEERRVELTKLIKRMGEDSKIAVRNIRRDIMDDIKRREKDGEISEDEQKMEQEEIQKLTDEKIKQIDEIVEEKNKELMEI
ncbi:MAG: ribosome recycling factor [Clostridiales bacterium]|nr:ribosome recycling factor [Clostridiales bacterium]